MATKPRKLVKTVPSRLQDIYPDVQVYQDELDHSLRDQRDLLIQAEQIFSTIENPTAVHRSKTHPAGMLLVNSDIVSTAGDPLRVAIKVLRDGNTADAFLSTAHFASSKNHGELLWKKDEE